MDAHGRPVHLAAHGRGVVLLDPLVGEYLIGSRAPASLLSIGSWNLQMARDTPLGAIFPSLLRLPADDLWRHPNLERLLALRPTAVIPYTPLPKAPAVGLPVFSFETLGEAAWWLHNAPAAARLTGQPARAAQLVRDHADDMDGLRRDLAAAGPFDRPVSLLAIAPHVDHSMGGLHSKPDPLLQLVGGRDPAVGFGEGRINPEALLKLDPDVIVLERTSDATPASFMADPRWRGLRAVHDRRVYSRPPGLAFTTQGILERPIYARWLAEILRPDRMAPRLRSVMRCAYARTLGYDMTDAQLDRLLAVDENRSSYGYARFTRAAPPSSCPPAGRSGA